MDMQDINKLHTVLGNNPALWTEAIKENSMKVGDEIQINLGKKRVARVSFEQLENIALQFEKKGSGHMLHALRERFEHVNAPDPAPLARAKHFPTEKPQKIIKDPQNALRNLFIAIFPKDLPEDTEELMGYSLADQIRTVTLAADAQQLREAYQLFNQLEQTAHLTKKQEGAVNKAMLKLEKKLPPTEG
jgi:hypothetical protein